MMCKYIDSRWLELLWSVTIVNSTVSHTSSYFWNIGRNEKLILYNEKFLICVHRGDF